MSDIKLPQIRVNIQKTTDTPTVDNPNSQVNPSCLLAYLGIRGFGTNVSTSTTSTIAIEKLAVPLLGYYDIFKNYYANTQEEDFYIIGATEAIDSIQVEQTSGGIFNSNTPDNIQIGIATGDNVTITPTNTYDADELIITWFNQALEKTVTGTPTDFGTWNKNTGIWTVQMPTTQVGVLMSITPINRVSLKNYPLKDIKIGRAHV